MKNRISAFIFVMLIVFASCKKDSDNANSTTKASVPAPVANFTYTGANTNAPATVTFINTSQNATSHSWDFGDGATSGTESPSHTFMLGGSYSVTLTAAGAGGVNSLTKVVTVMNITVDTIPPVVTLNGSANMTISLNSTFTDPGAIANDTKDGPVLVSVSGTVDVNTVGTYTLTYTATDLAGNVGSTTRLVNVVNDAQKYAGIYNVTEDTYSWQQTITTDAHVNNRIIFSQFALYNNNNKVYATISGTSVYLPTQAAAGIGNNGCTHNFAPNGSGNPITQVSGKYQFSIKFTDEQINGGSGCPGTSVVPYEDFFVQQ